MQSFHLSNVWQEEENNLADPLNKSWLTTHLELLGCVASDTYVGEENFTLGFGVEVRKEEEITWKT